MEIAAGVDKEDLARFVNELDPYELEILQEVQKRSGRVANDYFPYGHPETLKVDGWSKKPWQWDFHAAGKTHPYRMLSCANRMGKTFAICQEDGMHWTGNYPGWWPGRVWDRPVDWGVAGETNETTRNILQYTLFGNPQTGVPGIVPPDRILKTMNRSCNITGVYEEVHVAHEKMHKYGRPSIVQIKSYKQGWSTFQGTSKDGYHLDEEPNPDEKTQRKIPNEVRMRLVDKNGILMVGFTSLRMRTDIVSFFLDKSGPAGDLKCIIEAGWKDQYHLSKEAQRAALDGMDENERLARTEGKIITGYGTVVMGNRYDLECEPFQIPDHWPQIAAVDFGFNHPQGYARIAIDPDTGIIYLIDVYKMKGKLPAYHAEAIKSRGEWVPVSWPHDGLKGDRDGIPLWKAYLGYGCRMLSMSARFDNKRGGSQGNENQFTMINEKIAAGQFRVFETAGEVFFDEVSKITRDETGKILDKNDDVVKAVIYAVMMMRFATSRAESMGGGRRRMLYRRPML